MKKLGLLVMPLTATLFLASCGSKPVDPSKIDLYKKENIYDETGKNIVTTNEYEYNNKGLCIKATQINLAYPNMKDIWEYTYDKYENETGTHLISYDGEEITFESWMITEYTYDKQNRVTNQLTKMSFDGKEWVDYESYKYEYQENVTIERSYGGDGDLDYTATYTYDEKGNLISKKMVYVNQEGELKVYDWEDIYTIDENGCATTIDHYVYESEEKTLSNTTKITYLNNLWYRPLKEVIEYYIGEETGYSTVEREYDKKNRITLEKMYDGTDEETSSEYDYYFTYEY